MNLATEDKTDWWTGDELPDPTPERTPRPTGWRLIVRPIAPKTKSEGGVLIPQMTADTEALMITIGRVIAIGNECWKGDRFGVGLWATVGDFVMYGKYAGQKLEVDGVRLLILNDDEITAVVPEPEAVKRG